MEHLNTQPSADALQVSLILPAHNEERRLDATTSLYAEALLAAFGPNFEIVVVCNGCTDQTVAVARGQARHWPQVQVLVIDAPIGKGGAVLAGFQAARSEQVVFADADAATSPASLLSLLPDLKRFDLVIGSRRLPDSRITRPQPTARRFFGWGFARLAQALFHLPYHDTQCGAKALRRPAALALAGLVTERRWTFDLDLLLSARRLGLRVAERPVEWADQEGTRLRVVPTAGEVLRSLWRLRQRAGQPTPEWAESRREPGQVGT